MDAWLWWWLNADWSGKVGVPVCGAGEARREEEIEDKEEESVCERGMDGGVGDCCCERSGDEVVDEAAAGDMVMGAA